MREGERERANFASVRVVDVYVAQILRLIHLHSYRYVPPLLWGTNGHIQTILFGIIGRFSIQSTQGERHSVTVPDGSTVFYDFYEPSEPTSIIYIVCPGLS